MRGWRVARTSDAADRELVRKRGERRFDAAAANTRRASENYRVVMRFMQ
jgi:hypothetical protein